MLHWVGLLQAKRDTVITSVIVHIYFVRDIRFKKHMIKYQQKWERVFAAPCNYFIKIKYLLIA